METGGVLGVLWDTARYYGYWDYLGLPEGSVRYCGLLYGTSGYCCVLLGAGGYLVVIE